MCGLTSTCNRTYTWKRTCVRHSCSKKTSLVTLSALTQNGKPNLTYTMQTNLCQTRVWRERIQNVGLWSVFRFLWIDSLHNTKSQNIKGSKERYLLGQDRTG